MPLTRVVLLSFLCFASALPPARANVLIKVDQSNQRMIVLVNGEPRFSWPVSTGKTGYNTPNGIFRPNRMEAEHFSDEYESAPMPHAIFFDKQGHAIHGSSERLGRPASHGCVRISPGHAAELFSLVERERMGNTTVEITGGVATTVSPAPLPGAPLPVVTSPAPVVSEKVSIVRPGSVIPADVELEPFVDAQIPALRRYSYFVSPSNKIVVVEPVGRRVVRVLER
jgi:L,D-transpeptidase catalytic domain